MTAYEYSKAQFWFSTFSAMLRFAGSALYAIAAECHTGVIILRLQVTTLCAEIIGGLSFQHLPAITSRYIQV